MLISELELAFILNICNILVNFSSMEMSTASEGKANEQAVEFLTNIGKRW